MKNIAIIGGGISGISCAYFLDKLATIKSKQINIDIIEKHSEFAQDKIGNFQYGQEIYDNGWHNSIKANGLLFQIMLELGLYKYLIESKETKKVIYTETGIKIFPEKMLFGYPLDKGELLQSDIFTLQEKLSILLKLHKNNKLENIDKITVEDFFLSKINNIVYKKIIEPLLTSHYGSDISKQNFSFLMSELAFATIKNNDVENVVNEMYKNKVTDNIILGKEYRLKFTLRSFIENLESYFTNKVFIEFNSEVAEIEKCGDGYFVTYGGKRHYYDYVIVSTKHTEFLAWFEEDKRLNKYYSDLKFTSNIVATLIVKKDNIQINGDIGEIIFDKELNKFITKVEYVSNKWIDIKSQNIHMLRVYINRQDKVKQLLEKSDSTIQKIILKELEELHENINIEKIYINKVENNYLYADTKYSKYIHEIDMYLSENYDKIFFIGNSKKAIDLENTILESRDLARTLIEKI